MSPLFQLHPYHDFGQVAEVSYFRVPGDSQQSKIAWIPGLARGLIPPGYPQASHLLLGLAWPWKRS